MSIITEMFEDVDESAVPDAPQTEAAYSPPDQAENPRAVIGDNNPPLEERLDERPPPENWLDGYLTQAEVAKMFGVTERCIRKWMNLPDGLPFVTVGRRTYIPGQRGKEWLASRIQQRNPTKRGRR